MNYLIGTYECKIDVKGRLLIPIALKKQIADSVSQGFVLKRAVFQQCLELYPMQQWKDLISKVNKNNDFIRRFTAGLKFIELDNTGRLLIPKELTEFANIRREIVLSSSVNIIEIWDKSKYEKTIDDSKSDFAQLAEEVMGDDEN